MLQTLLQKRSNGYYYFRWVCPPAIRKVLGKREIIKSLRTTSKIQALARAGAYYMAVDKFKALELELQSKCDNGLMEEQDAIDEFCLQYYEDYAPKLFSMLMAGEQPYKADSLLDAERDRALFTAGMEAYRKSLTNRLGEFAEGISIYDTVEKMVSDYPNIPELQGNEIVRALHMVGQAFNDSPVVYDRFIKDLTQVQYFNIESFRKDLEPSLLELPIPRFLKRNTVSEQAIALPSPLLSAVFEEFLAHKISNEDLSLGAQKDYQTNFPVLLHFIGDVPIADITGRKVKACLQACLKFPKRTLKPYRGKSVAEIAALDIPENHRLAAKSVENYKKLLQGIFAYAKEQEYIQQSPAVDLNLGIKVPKVKAPFSNSEVRILLRAANALNGKHEERKWIVLLGAYTGARLGEITQLRREDIKVDLETGIKYLRITSEAGALKTDNANRLVPIHSKLLELGFEEFAGSVDGEGRLFANYFGKARKITSWFPSFVNGLAIPKLNDLNQSRTFHSFRHSFITEARGASQSIDLVQAIVGHEKTSAGQTDVYTGHYTVDKLQPVVESITYL